MAMYNENGYRLSPVAANEILEKRFFPSDSVPSEFPNLSDLLGSDWPSNSDNPIAYRNSALMACERIYGSVLEKKPVLIAPLALIPVTIKKTILRIQKEIVDDVLAGHVPLSCSSFVELDGCRDANVYGGLGDDELFEKLISHFGGRDEDEGMPAGMFNYVTQARLATDDWLRSGGLLIACPPPGWKSFSDDVDHFNSLGNKPFDSVFEKRIGGNGYPTCDLTVLSDGVNFCAAHGGMVMPEHVASAKAAADIAMTWAVENGWSNDDLDNSVLRRDSPDIVGMDAPVPAFSPFLDHAACAAHELHALLLSQAPNLVKEGVWSGKVLDVENGVVIQKINRAGDTVQHDAAKLSEPVCNGVVVDIKYIGGVGLVSGLDKGLGGVSR